MEDVGVKSLCMLAAILYGVIGFDYTLGQTEKEDLSYLPSITSGNFTFWDCSSKKSMLNVTAFNISPDPIRFDRWKGTYIRVTCQYELAETIPEESKIEVDLNLRLKTPGKDINLCDLVGEEICHYNDLMAELQEHNTTVNPKYLKKGNHTIPKARLRMSTLPFILRGTFEASFYIKQQGKDIGCLGIRFCVTECMF